MGILSREALSAHNDWTLAKGWAKVDSKGGRVVRKKHDGQGCNTEKLNYFVRPPCRIARGVFFHNHTTTQKNRGDKK